jgi:SlyX protein
VIDGGAPAVNDATRIETLEFKLAHLERAVQELSDVLYRQQRELDGVVEVNRQLRRQLEEFATRAADGSVAEIPPHY